MGLSCLKFLMSGFASQTDELNVEDQGRVGWNNVPKPTFTYIRASIRKKYEWVGRATNHKPCGEGWLVYAFRRRTSQRGLHPSL